MGASSGPVRTPMRRLLFLTSLLVILTSCSSTETPDGARECADCPEMVLVPEGTAVVGVSATDHMGNPDEMPQRIFVIPEPFAVSKYEITRDQYEAFVRATGRAVEGNCLTDRVRHGDWEIDAGTTFRDPGFPQSGDHPVACVSWDDTKAYVAWLNKQTRGGYRLLTEVEWEYVARGGAPEDASYPWGSDAAEGCRFANGFDQTAMAAYAGIDTSGFKVFDPLPCSDGWLNTAPIGSLAPNRFGVYDMIGNVSEWIEDCHSASHDALSSSGAPPAVAGACSQRIAKGGSWGTLAHNLRIAERFPYEPAHRDDSIGIRVAKTLR
jgi:formylglycine-generating enzyme required for sulfatase activity